MEKRARLYEVFLQRNGRKIWKNVSLAISEATNHSEITKNVKELSKQF